MDKREMRNTLESAEKTLRELIDYHDADSAQLGFAVADDLKRIREALEGD